VTNGDGGGATEPGTQELFDDSSLELMLYTLVVNLFGWFVFAGGYLLDFAVTHFVINFGLEFNTSGVGVAVNDLWSLVRDFFNILFIFGFIWIGFQMILDSSSQAKQTLVTLIMAALLVNFSLFISKFVVDFSNRLASEIALAGFPKIDPDDARYQITASSQVDIANTFFAHLGVASTLEAPTELVRGERAPWAFIFGSAIFYLIAAFVFAAGGIMLIIRFVALSIFMVLSPFMFLGWVFPGMKSWTSKYWTNFLGRAFYAPVYILLLFFAGTILQNMFGRGGSAEVTINGNATGAGLLEGITNYQDNLITVLGPFILSATFMMAAVIVAGKMSADGAGGVMKVGGSLVQGGRRRLQNGAIGTARFGGRTATALPREGLRRTANFTGNKMNQYLDTKQRQGSKLANNWWVDEKVRGTATNLKATKAGFANTIDERDKKQSKLDTRSEAWEDINKGREAASAIYETSDPTAVYDPSTKGIMARSALAAISPARLKAAENAEQEREKAKAAMVGRLRDLSPKELGELFENDEKAFDDIIGFLDDGKVEKLLESEDLNTTQTKAIFNKRTSALKASVIKQGVSIATEFSKLNIKQIELLGDTFIRENAEMFNEDQWDAIKKSDKFTATQKGSYLGARKSRVKEILASTGSNPEVGGLLFNSVGAIQGSNGKWTKANDPKKFKKPKEIAALPYDALVDKRLIAQLPVDAVKQIGRDNAGGKSHLSADEVDKLYNELKVSGNAKVIAYLKTTRAQRDFLDSI